MTLAILHLFLNDPSDEAYQETIHILKTLTQGHPADLSISPAKVARGSQEVYATIQIKKEDIPSLLDLLADQWDGDDENCECYDFLTKIHLPHVDTMVFWIA